MFTQNSAGVYQSSVFPDVHGLRHGFSSRVNGDARDLHVVEDVLVREGFVGRQFTGAEQIHGKGVAVVSDSVSGIVAEADALIVAASGRVVGVRTADCVPILLADPVAGIAASVHAGWRGTVAGVVRETVDAMCREGAAADRLCVAVGPHIGGCCYTVTKDRADTFVSRYGTDSGVVREKNGVRYLDLGAANYTDLITAGIRREAIDRSSLCTSCRNDLFYSYRKDSTETFGEMIGYIGFVHA